MSTPLALSPALPHELISWILTYQSQSQPITLLICQPRSEFLISLQTSIPNTIPRQPPSPPPLPRLDESSSPNPPSPTPLEEELETEPEVPARHPLLIPTLHQIATSRKINLVFIPTVSHLRAYLSVFASPEKEEGKVISLEFENPEKKKKKKGGLLVVYKILELHKDTSEWSAQGLSISLAGLVEAGWRGERRVVLVEEKGVDSVMDEHGGEDDQRRKEAEKLWEDRVPILNGGVKRIGFENEDSGWTGRTVEVGRVFSRWFKFRRGEWDINQKE